MTLLRRIYRVVGWRIVWKLTRIRVEMGKRGAPVPFGVHLNSPGSVVIVLPEDPLRALISVPVLLGFISRFSKADVSLLCTEMVAPYFREVEGVSRVLTYTEQREFYFSRSRMKVVSELASLRSSLWLYLEHSPRPILTYLSVAAKPAVRAGKSEGESSNRLLNLSIHPAHSGRVGIEEYRPLTRFFEVKVPDTVRWRTTKEAVAQVRHVLEENGIPTGTEPAGIDAVFLGAHFGKQWTASLVQKLTTEFPSIGWFVFSEAPTNDEWNEWLRGLRLPGIVGLSASATAALLTTSTGFISGETYLYQLSVLMGKPAIGLFPEEKSSICPTRGDDRCLILPVEPDEQSLSDVLRLCALIAR